MAQNLALTPLYNKKRELETLIATLHSQKDIALRESTEASENVTEIRTRIAKLEEEVASMEKEALESLTKAGEAVLKGIEAVKDGRQVVEGVVSMLKALETRVDELIAKAEKSKEDHKNTLAEISRENELIDASWRDVKVIKGRLQKKSDELNLGPINI